MRRTSAGAEVRLLFWPKGKVTTWAKSLAFWLISIAILLAIWRHLDLTALATDIEKVNPWLVAVGAAFSPLAALFGGFRWRRLLLPHFSKSIQLSFCLKHLWISMAMGIIGTPLAGDAYRAIVGGRRLGRYILNIVVILVEKVLILSTCVFLIICLYPLLDIPFESQVHRISLFAWAVGIALLAGFIVLSAIFRSGQNRACAVFTMQFHKAIASILKKGEISNVSLQDDETRDSVVASLRNIIKPSSLLPNLCLSLLILLTAAVAHYFFFRAANYEISFVANLFVVPALYVVLNLPISLIGLREGSHILLYGIFGVPVETALLVSFFSGLGVLLNYSIGGLFALHGHLKPLLSSRS